MGEWLYALKRFVVIEDNVGTGWATAPRGQNGINPLASVTVHSFLICSYTTVEDILLHGVSTWLFLPQVMASSANEKRVRPVFFRLPTRPCSFVIFVRFSLHRRRENLPSHLCEPHTSVSSHTGITLSVGWRRVRVLAGKSEIRGVWEVGCFVRNSNPGDNR